MSLRERMLKELDGQLDLDRIHFLGRIPHPQLMAVLQASWVHVYFSFPFILSWSLIEAMACGCSIIGSEGMPVSEVIQDGVEGILIPMNDPLLLANKVIQLLSDPIARLRLSKAARLRALMYDQRLTRNQLLELLQV